MRHGDKTETSEPESKPEPGAGLEPVLESTHTPTDEDGVLVQVPLNEYGSRRTVLGGKKLRDYLPWSKFKKTQSEIRVDLEDTNRQLDLARARLGGSSKNTTDEIQKLIAHKNDLERILTERGLVFGGGLTKKRKNKYKKKSHKRKSHKRKYKKRKSHKRKSRRRSKRR